MEKVTFNDLCQKYNAAVEILKTAGCHFSVRMAEDLQLAITSAEMLNRMVEQEEVGEAIAPEKLTYLFVATTMLKVEAIRALGQFELARQNGQSAIAHIANCESRFRQNLSDLWNLQQAMCWLGLAKQTFDNGFPRAMLAAAFRYYDRVNALGAPNGLERQEVLAEEIRVTVPRIVRGISLTHYLRQAVASRCKLSDEPSREVKEALNLYAYTSGHIGDRHTHEGEGAPMPAFDGNPWILVPIEPIMEQSEGSD